MILSSRSGKPLRVFIVAAAIGFVPAIAGCAAGGNAPTQQWHRPTPGASAAVDTTLRLNNVFVLGAPPADSLPKGGSAGLFLAVSNDGSSDTLVQVSAPGSAGAVRLPAGGIPIGSQRTVLLTGPAPRIVLEKLTRSLGGGVSIPIVLDFRKAGSVTLQVPVMPRAQAYSTFSPPPAAPSPTATPLTKKKRHHRASASPSPPSIPPSQGPTTTPTPTPTTTTTG